LSASTEWFFKKGSAGEKAFTAFEGKVAKADDGSVKGEQRAREMAGEEVEGAKEVVGRLETEADKKGDVRSLERKADRTLYLVLKKDRKEHAWQFRTLSFLSFLSFLLPFPPSLPPFLPLSPFRFALFFPSLPSY
jgi:large subunit ribosomal protein L46